MDVDLKRGGDPCRQMLDLIPKERSWVVKDGGRGDGFGVTEERKLELRLGPPGQEWPAEKGKREEHPVVEPALTLGYSYGISKSTTTYRNAFVGAKRSFLGASEFKTEVLQQQPGFPQAKAELGKEFSNKTKGKAEQRECCPPPPPSNAFAAKNASLSSSSSTRSICGFHGTFISSSFFCNN